MPRSKAATPPTPPQSPPGAPERPASRTAVLTDLSALHTAPWNPRRITPAAFQALCASLAEDPSFMERRPILALADGTIYAGAMRYQAVTQLASEGRWPYGNQAPAILADVPEALAQARAMRDNLHGGQWEEALLGEILSDLHGLGFDLANLGLQERLLARAMKQLSEGDTFAIQRADGAHLKTPAERRAKSTWQDDGLAKVSLHYQLDAWRLVVEDFDWAREHTHTRSNADALFALLETWRTAHGIEPAPAAAAVQEGGDDA